MSIRHEPFDWQGVHFTDTSQINRWPAAQLDKEPGHPTHETPLLKALMTDHLSDPAAPFP